MNKKEVPDNIRCGEETLLNHEEEEVFQRHFHWRMYVRPKNPTDNDSKAIGPSISWTKLRDTVAATRDITSRICWKVQELSEEHKCQQHFDVIYHSFISLY